MAIVIAGAGALGRVMYDFFSLRQQVVGFVDDAPKFEGKRVCGLPVFKVDAIRRFGGEELEATLAVLHPNARENLARQIRDLGVPFTQFASETAFISPSAQIGSGCSLLPFSFVMNNAVIGDLVHIHFNSVVGHDVVVGDYCSIAPQCIIGGRSRIGTRVTLGMGVRVLPNITVEDDAILGAGAVVTRDVARGGVVSGNPARVMEKSG
jgi:UDP-perosamine 4-acetyltransferase